MVNGTWIRYLIRSGMSYFNNDTGPDDFDMKKPPFYPFQTF